MLSFSLLVQAYNYNHISLHQSYHLPWYVNELSAEKESLMLDQTFHVKMLSGI